MSKPTEGNKPPLGQLPEGFVQPKPSLANLGLPRTRWALEERQPIDRLIFQINYDETTPESAENGENSDSGSLFEEYHCEDFDSVIRMVEAYGREGWSSQPHTKGTGDWLQSHWEIDDYTTMTSRQTSIHALNNRSLKYLEKAWSVACTK